MPFLLFAPAPERFGPFDIYRPDGQLALIHAFSALGTLEYRASPRLEIYANYGGHYVGRRYFLTSANGGSV